MLLVENSFRSVILGGLLSLSACASTPLVEGQLPGAVADDAVEFNESFARATDAEVLKNILRARDRWPRLYSAISDVSNDRNIQTQAQLGFEFPFNALKNGNSTPQITQTFGSEPTTTYKPQNSQEFTRAIFTPIPAWLFEHYWNSGWPKDVLLLVLVNSIREEDGSPAAFNSGKGIEPCEGEVRKWYDSKKHSKSAAQDAGAQNASDTKSKKDPRCAYILLVHQLLKDRHPETANRQLKLSISRKPKKNGAKKNGAKESAEEGYDNCGDKCKPIGRELSGKDEASLKTIAALAKVLKDAGETVKYSFKHNQLYVDRSKSKIWITDKDNHKSYELSLRSLDGMIYYLGEIARLSDPPKVVRPPTKTKKAETNNEMTDQKLEYLFRVTKNKPCGRYYAASVVHNGKRYYAGPPTNAHATGQDSSEQDSDDDCANDRTATVLTLLDEVRALNQTAESLRGPTNVNVVGGKL